MIRLYDFIVESKDDEDKGKLTSSNKERLELLQKILKNKTYSKYIDTLNKMLDDPKAKILLKDGFGGELGNMQFTFKKRNIPVRKLRPTQSEIDITKSVDFPLEHPENIDNFYKNANACEIIMPLITFRGNYIIDGHHRWSQVFAFNPDAKMVCFDYDADISPIQMLKATQGAIAAVKAENGDGKIPVNTVDGENVFDEKLDSNAIKEHIKKTAVDGVVDTFKKYKKELTDIDKVSDFVTDNLMSLKANNYPETIKGESAPNRGLMPQTDKGGTDSGNKKTALPSKPGSALNKLKDGKFVQSIL